MTAASLDTPAVDYEGNVAAVRGRIERACDRAGRAPGSVVLVAVSKTHPPEAIAAVAAAGVHDFGENRVGEWLAKRDRVDGARWHFIGRLQSRKASQIAGRQVLVHSVDRRSLADRLARQSEQLDAIQRILIQVNAGDDPAKGGCPVDEVLDLVAYARDLPHLTVEGLMTMPPLPPEDAGPEANREVFATMRRLRDEAKQQWQEVAHLSMGMSADLEIAVEEGATIVRVGTALFGPRGQSAWQPSEGWR